MNKEQTREWRPGSSQLSESLGYFYHGANNSLEVVICFEMWHLYLTKSSEKITVQYLLRIQQTGDSCLYQNHLFLKMNSCHNIKIFSPWIAYIEPGFPMPFPYIARHSTIQKQYLFSLFIFDRLYFDHSQVAWASCCSPYNQNWLSSLHSIPISWWHGWRNWTLVHGIGSSWWDFMVWLYCTPHCQCLWVPLDIAHIIPGLLIQVSNLYKVSD